MSASEYAGIARYYDKWCLGDEAYIPSGEFYTEFLREHSGVFAEIGVGSGRIALPVSEREDVTVVFGVDCCPEMLAICEANMTPNNHLELIAADFLTFELPVAADVIYMPFRSIGHILGNEELVEFFHRIHRNLKSGGIFIFDHYIFNRQWAEEHDGLEREMYKDSELRLTDCYTYDFAKQLMHCVVRCNDEVVSCFDFRWIDAGTFLSAAGGFEIKEMYGDFDRSIFVPSSPNQIWILRKVEEENDILR